MSRRGLQRTKGRNSDRMSCQCGVHSAKLWSTNQPDTLLVYNVDFPFKHRSFYFKAVKGDPQTFTPIMGDNITRF